jgi:SIR2-like protein
MACSLCRWLARRISGGRDPEQHRRPTKQNVDAVELEQLLKIIRGERETIVPFVGSGLTIGAGAPPVWRLAGEMVKRGSLTGLSEPDDLVEVSAAAEAQLGLSDTRVLLADIMTGLRLRPTAALMAVASTPMRKVMTTNYDDAIERAACRRGLTPVPMLGTDVRAQDTPLEGELYVIHIHGMPSEPDSLVLPGRTTEDLVADEQFTRFISTTLASRELLYLGFSLGEGEVHLHAMLKWVAEKVDDARAHYLLLPEDEIVERAAEIRTIAGYGNVKVASYVKDRAHTGVERAALALAPRSDDEAGPGDQVTTVRSVLAEFDPADGWEQVQRAASSFDLGTGFTTVTDPAELLKLNRAVIVAGPGMGKTTLLRYLPSLADGRACGVARLADFHPAGDGVDPAEPIWDLMREVGGDKRMRVEVLDGAPGVLMLDGLEEAGSRNAVAVVNAISAAYRERPQHCWIVTSRPALAAVGLAGTGFTCLGILASRKWARTYLETRGVPEHRIRRAMLDGYGLGDLLTIPQFAARLADRLLDEDDQRVFTPLDLLVAEQQSVAAREAQTRGLTTGLLARWLRGIAAGLELRGLASAPVVDIAAVVADGPLAPQASRDVLVELSLLVDVPDIAAFQHKTLQEGIVARAVLDSSDPAALVELIAVNRQSGAPVVRDDTEFMLDLVFEHATPTQRVALRSIDERRWARTVITRGTIDDGREALGVLWDWHEQRGLTFVFLESGLRTSLAAVAAIAGKWPQLVEERRTQLIADVAATDSARTMRALTLLAQLPADHDTASWLLPLLDDLRSQVVAEAVALAGRLRFGSAADRVLELLAGRTDGTVRRAALIAAVQLLPSQRLPELAAVAGHNTLRYLAERLLERNDFDLDTGIAFVSSAREMDETNAWIVERLIDTAHKNAWTEARVGALARSLRKVSGGGTPDPARIAAVFNKHPTAVLNAVGSVPSAPAARAVGRPVLLALAKLDPVLLVGDDLTFLREAITEAVVEQADYECRRNRYGLQLAEIVAKLDADGNDVPLEDLTTGVPPLRSLDKQHKAVIAAIVDKHWPESLLGEENEAVVERIASLGADIRPPLTRDRWMQVLELYLSASLVGRFDMSMDIPGWLRETLPSDCLSVLEPMVAAAADPWTLTKLVATAGAPRLNAELTAAAFKRLRQLRPDEKHWNTCAGWLISEATIDEGRTLLALDLPAAVRQYLTTLLAREGDADAQVDVIDQLRDEVNAGNEPETPHWSRDVTEPQVLDALATLARAAIDHNASGVLGFALGTILKNEGDHALTLITALEADYGNANADVSIRAEQLRRRRATRVVLGRLPPTVAEVATWFESQARGFHP